MCWAIKSLNAVHTVMTAATPPLLLRTCLLAMSSFYLRSCDQFAYDQLRESIAVSVIDIFCMDSLITMCMKTRKVVKRTM